EMGFALMAVNLRKYTAINNENGIFSHKNKRKKGCIYLLLINTTFFVYLGLGMSHPRFWLNFTLHFSFNIIRRIFFKMSKCTYFTYNIIFIFTINKLGCFQSITF